MFTILGITCRGSLPVDLLVLQEYFPILNNTHCETAVVRRRRSKPVQYLNQ